MMRTLRASKTWLVLTFIAALGVLSAPLSAFACCCAGMLPTAPVAQVARTTPLHVAPATGSAMEDMPCCRQQESQTEGKNVAAQSSTWPVDEARISLHFVSNHATAPALSHVATQGAKLAPGHECDCYHDDDLTPAVTENRLAAPYFIPIGGVLPSGTFATAPSSYSTTVPPTSSPFFYRSEAARPFAGRAPPLN